MDGTKKGGTSKKCNKKKSRASHIVRIDNVLGIDIKINKFQAFKPFASLTLYLCIFTNN